MNIPQKLEPTDAALFRSPLLLDRRRSLLLIVDVQEKLMPFVRAKETVQWNLDRLLRGAQILGVEIAATEQYPEGLGPTIAPLRDKIARMATKRMFSCRECVDLLGEWLRGGFRQILVAGIETHVCVMQTALDLQAAGWEVFVPADAVGSRSELDHQIALRRMELSGITILTTESALFEWCETSGISEFKQISQLVKQSTPPAQ